MSATATVMCSVSTTQALTHLSSTTRTTFAANLPLSSNHFFFKLPLGHRHKASSSSSSSSSSKRNPTFHGFKRYYSPVMEWQDCTVKMEIDVPVSVAYNCYSDREAIPNWMPFISSVKILPDKPDLSRWSLKYKAFGRNIEFSWLARNMQEKISNLIL